MNIVKENGLTFILNHDDFTTNITQSPSAKGDVVIPNSINFQLHEYKIIKINEGSFKNNKRIRSISFDEYSSLQTICKNAFSYSSLSKLFIPSSLKELQEGWCLNTTKLNHISISTKNKNFSLIDSKIIVGKSDENNGFFDVLLFACRDISKFVVPSSIRNILFHLVDVLI